MLANVISIKDSYRREYALKRANKFGFEVRFFDAYNYVNDSASSHSNEFNLDKFYDKYGRYPASGEIGVFKSHFELWKELSKKKQSFHLVLEDDFIPKINASVIDKIILSAKNDYDVILLGYSKVNEVTEKTISIINPLKTEYHYKNYRLGKKFHESTCGALAYVVKDSFFQKIEKNQFKPYFLIDDWSIFKKMGIKILHISPLCFYEDYQGLGSDIDKSGRLSIDYETQKRNIIFIFLRNIYRRSIGLLLLSLMFFGIYSSSK